jgi:hypothetical protein
MVKLQFFVCQWFVNFLSQPSSRTRQSIFLAHTSNDVVCDKKVTFQDLINKNLFSRGNIPFLDFTKALCVQIEKVKKV